MSKDGMKRRCWCSDPLCEFSEQSGMTCKACGQPWGEHAGNGTHHCPALDGGVMAYNYESIWEPDMRTAPTHLPGT